MSRPGATGERSLALFLLGLLLFSPPLLSLFSAERFVAGLPLLYLYLFAGWGLLIVLIGVMATQASRGRSGAQASGPASAPTAPPSAPPSAQGRPTEEG
ncbi:MAG: hypothetical protein ACFCUQ_04210 [Kiloniellales bacterium]